MFFLTFFLFIHLSFINTVTKALYATVWISAIQIKHITDDITSFFLSQPAVETTSPGEYLKLVKGKVVRQRSGTRVPESAVVSSNKTDNLYQLWGLCVEARVWPLWQFLWGSWVEYQNIPPAWRFAGEPNGVSNGTPPSGETDSKRRS